MTQRLLRLLKQTILIGVAALLTLVAVRTWDIHRGPGLSRWHQYVPKELSAAGLDAASWVDWLAAEDAVFAAMQSQVVERLEASERVPFNRYNPVAAVHPGRFQTDWNRSFVLEPSGPVVGAAVLLHGLTDSPYSLRRIGEHYQSRGFVVIGMRMPGHGTVPAGLTAAKWKDWAAATRLAVREARRRSGPNVPLHLVGYSNGGALAMTYALDALDDPVLQQADQLILITPMIGVTGFASFAGVFGWPAVFPAFAKAAWLDILPEFNPFKYNSFPINAARQSSLLTRTLQGRIADLRQADALTGLPPILTFQSVVDATVSTEAIITGLYARLPANGSELVLFDVNHSVRFGPMLQAGNTNLLERLSPPAPLNYRLTRISNRDSADEEVMEIVLEAGARQTRTRPLGLHFPKTVFSLSHIAMPFAIDDPLYGLEPDRSEDFGLHLGALAVRGERGVMVVSQDWLARLPSNPFFPYLLERIDQAIP